MWNVLFNGGASCRSGSRLRLNSLRFRGPRKMKDHVSRLNYKRSNKERGWESSSLLESRILISARSARASRLPCFDKQFQNPFGASQNRLPARRAPVDARTGYIKKSFTRRARKFISIPTNEAALGRLSKPHGAITIRLALLQNIHYASLIASNINFIRHSVRSVTRCTVEEILLRAFCAPVRNVT